MFDHRFHLHLDNGFLLPKTSGTRSRRRRLTNELWSLLEHDRSFSLCVRRNRVSDADNGFMLLSRQIPLYFEICSRFSDSLLLYFRFGVLPYIRSKLNRTHNAADDADWQSILLSAQVHIHHQHNMRVPSSYLSSQYRRGFIPVQQKATIMDYALAKEFAKNDDCLFDCICSCRVSE